MEVQLLEPISFYLKQIDDTFSMYFHSHSYYEFMYCVKDRFVFEYLDNENLIHKMFVNENEIIFVSSYLKHRIYVLSGETSFIGNIEYSLTSKSYSAIQKIINYSAYFKEVLLNEMKNSVGFLIIKDHFLIQKPMIKIIDLLNNQYMPSDIEIAVTTIDFFYAISRSLMKKKEGKYGFIRKSIEYINENYNKNISVEELAKRENITASYFAHRFKKDQGISVLKYINTLRVNKACYLLNSTNLPITKIAEMVGFKDNDELNYQFKIVMNTSPTKYKQRRDYIQINDTMIGDYKSNKYENIN